MDKESQKRLEEFLQLWRELDAYTFHPNHHADCFNETEFIEDKHAHFQMIDVNVVKYVLPKEKYKGGCRVIGGKNALKECREAISNPNDPEQIIAWRKKFYRTKMDTLAWKEMLFRLRTIKEYFKEGNRVYEAAA